MNGSEVKEWRLSLPAKLASGKRRRFVTQLDAAKLLGVSGSTVNRWELHGVAPETEPMLRYAMAAILWGLPQWREVRHDEDGWTHTTNANGVPVQWKVAESDNEPIQF